MPNHFHVIIQIIRYNPVGAGSPLPNVIDPYANLNKKYQNINNRHTNVNEIHIDMNNVNPILNKTHQNNICTIENIGSNNVNIGSNNVTHGNGNRLGGNTIGSIFNTNRSGVITIGQGNLAPTLGQIVGFFKYGVSKRINQIRKTPGTKLWQRNYYEHIIRDENEYRRISEYIKNNPMKWEIDYFNSY